MRDDCSRPGIGDFRRCDAACLEEHADDFEGNDDEWREQERDSLVDARDRERFFVPIIRREAVYSVRV